jgi:flagellar basal body-associated protein FliL
MAEGTTEGGEGAEGAKKKKGVKGLIIKIIPLLLIAFVALKMTVLKPPPLTPAQAAEKALVAEYHLDAKCAAANHLPAPKPPKDLPASATTTTAPASTPTTVAEAVGPVLELDSKTLNLDGSHFLKVGVSLQLPAGAVPDEVKTTENWSSVASQLVLDTFSGRSFAQLSDDKLRVELQHEIGDEVCHRTEGEVVTVYFIDFVMQ